MNNFYFLLQVQTPDLIEKQSNEVQLIYFFGGLIVLGLLAALTYFRLRLNKKDEIIKRKEDVIEKKEAEKIELINKMHESDKANIEVFKDMISIIKQNNSSTLALEKLIMQETNPDIKTILRELSK